MRFTFAWCLNPTLICLLYTSAIQEANKQISDWQKQLERITGAKGVESKTTGKDPFLEKLEKYKSEYTRFYKWINSGDEAIARAASAEFEGLLKEGATYIDYLKKQRDTILSVDIESRTKEQNKQLRMLNDQIAEETKKTVLEAFNTELAEQLNLSLIHIFGWYCCRRQKDGCGILFNG